MPLTEKITVTRSKHTVDGEYDFALSIERGRKLLVVAETFGRLSDHVTSPAKAYAELFAAAPELLDALKKLSTFIGNSSFTPQSMVDEADALLVIAYAAIAKATGV